MIAGREVCTPPSSTAALDGTGVDKMVGAQSWLGPIFLCNFLRVNPMIGRSKDCGDNVTGGSGPRIPGGAGNMKRTVRVAVPQ
jgi:hypothetical protein